MGRRAVDARRQTRRSVRETRLTETEKDLLRRQAVYEGSPYHKRNPGDFGLTPPANPRPDKTLCDLASIFKRSDAQALFALAIERGLASRAEVDGFPKQMWVVDDKNRVFEAMLGGSKTGCYHGYPIRETDPLHAVIIAAWRENDDAAA